MRGSRLRSNEFDVRDYQKDFPAENPREHTGSSDGHTSLPLIGTVRAVDLVVVAVAALVIIVLARGSYRSANDAVNESHAHVVDVAQRLNKKIRLPASY